MVEIVSESIFSRRIKMRRLIVVSAGVDSDGVWAHQACPGVFETPDAALAAFKKDWSEDIEFYLERLDTGTYRIMRDEIVEGLIVPIEE